MLIVVYNNQQATLSALVSSSFVEAVQYAVAEGVKCCRLLGALESSSFYEIVESVVDDVDCCKVHYVL